MHTAHLDGQRTRPHRDLELALEGACGLRAGAGHPLLAFAGEGHPAREREHDEEQDCRDRSATPPLAPAYRFPASAEALVRVQ